MVPLLVRTLLTLGMAACALLSDFLNPKPQTLNVFFETLNPRPLIL